mmetsp:Transcript_129138/g.413908  ORF Transcript_129138/g.413908 Transcript_129138/m.413908 type:complete len:205 (-) Transcript_129138:225-839(-)
MIEPRLRRRTRSPAPRHGGLQPRNLLPGQRGLRGTDLLLGGLRHVLRLPRVVVVLPRRRHDLRRPLGLRRRCIGSVGGGLLDGSSGCKRRIHGGRRRCLLALDASRLCHAASNRCGGAAAAAALVRLLLLLRMRRPLQGHHPRTRWRKHRRRGSATAVLGPSAAGTGREVAVEVRSRWQGGLTSLHVGKCGAALGPSVRRSHIR